MSPTPAQNCDEATQFVEPRVAQSCMEPMLSPQAPCHVELVTGVTGVLQQQGHRKQSKALTQHDRNRTSGGQSEEVGQFLFSQLQTTSLSLTFKRCRKSGVGKAPRGSHRSCKSVPTCPFPRELEKRCKFTATSFICKCFYIVAKYRWHEMYHFNRV